MDERECTKCRKTKPLASFGKAKKGRYGRRASCLDCDNAAVRARYAADPEPRKALSRARYAADPEPVRQRIRASHAADPTKMRARVGKRRALKRDVTIGVVDLSSVRAAYDGCYLCGQQLDEDTHFDHIVPLARGGAHCNANLAPTHPACNWRKSDRFLSELDWYDGPTDLGIYATMAT